MKKLIPHAPLVFLLLAALCVGSYQVDAKEPKGRKTQSGKSLQKGAVLEHANFDGNRMNDIMMNNGQYVSHVITGNSGMEWPKGSFNLIDYAAGIWVAGKDPGGVVRTAAAEYAVEFTPGKILASGSRDDETLPNYRWFKISRADLTNPGFDYLNWPFDDGAPALQNAAGTGDSLDANGNRIPALIGDQMLWCVFNDLDAAKHGPVFGTPPMGIEVQMTVWGYNRPDAFGDMMFVKAKIINKSTRSYDSTFVALWDDPDLGDAGDDYVGCDTTLSLGYCWNGTNDDHDYHAAPPVIGRDFFQGPIVPSPGDTALVSGKRIPGFKNLPMYSFAYYINGAPYPRQDPAGSQEVFNYMTGRFQDGSQFINPLTSQPTRFIFSGDPETNTGWTETNPTINQPGDRRFLMSNGPFTFAAGDTQEVVFGVLIARGNSNTNSVTVLKQVDAVAQLAYDLNFALPTSPPKVNASVSQLDRELIFTWDDKAESYDVQDLIDRDTTNATTRYKFEGYIVYQLNAPSAATATDIRRVAIYDLPNLVTEVKDFVFDTQRGEQILVTSVKGTDSGIKRSYRTTVDNITGTPLVNARPYYFAVTAYGYNEWGVPKMYEGPIEILTVYPSSPVSGLRLSSAVGDTLPGVAHTGPSDGSMIVLVADPSKVTGDAYSVGFRIVAGRPVWDLVNTTRGDTVLKAQSNQTGDDAYNIADGLMVKVLGAANDVKDFQHIAGPSGALTPVSYAAFAFNASGFPTTLVGPTGPNNPGATVDRPEQDWGGGQWGIHVNPDPNDISYTRFVARVFRNDNFNRFVPYDFEMRFTAAGSQAYMAFSSGSIVAVPFELWNIGINTPTDPSDDYRMIPWIFDENGDDAFSIQDADHSISGGTNDPYTDWIYWRDPNPRTPGTAGYDAFVAAGAGYNGTQGTGGEVMARMVLVNWNGGTVGTPMGTWTSVMPATGNVIRIIGTKPNSAVDTYTFSTAGYAPTATAANIKADINAINVVPNPYLGSSPLEVNPQNRFLTFTRLPNNKTVTIRIFTLSGVLVRQIVHSTNTTSERWDMRNADGIPVASGMYIAHIEVDGVGVKVLKLGIIQPEERLDRL